MNIDNWVTLDIECYPNYFLAMFRKIITGQIIYFEKFNESEMNRANIVRFLKKYTVVTFNGNMYDILMVEAAVAGFTNKGLYEINEMIFAEDESQKKKPWQIRKDLGLSRMQMDHIDIIEVCPLKASLKIYGGRIHSAKLADLPISPGTTIKESDLEDMRIYCGNDNIVTGDLTLTLKEELALRAAMSDQYGVDLRSKSDAQIAEEVIKKEMEDKYGVVAKRPSIKAGTVYNYVAPDNIVFNTPLLQDLYRQYTTLPFTVDKAGYIGFDFEMDESDRIKSGKNKGQMPKTKSQIAFTIGKTKYKAGIGGLHSCEKSTRHTNKGYILRDYDVESFYPRIILNNQLYPKHLGKPFLKIYESIVARRLKAKAEGNKTINESLKITINGSFGKLGSKWSCLYSPDLMMQVTVTGQLTLLMLIERLELAGISVVSANTDGIVVKMLPDQEKTCEDIMSDWEFDTDYKLESNDYISLNSRDINNYIAVKPSYTDKNGKFHPVSSKGKGAYADQSEHYYRLRSNPTNEICTIAVKEFLQTGVPIEKTIGQCTDIRKFLNLRTVNGGAVKSGVWLGKAIRWYYGVNELDAIYYATSGNKVPRSDGGVPLMDIPEKFPDDVDFQWYVNEAHDILKKIGYKGV